MTAPLRTNSNGHWLATVPTTTTPVAFYTCSGAKPP